MSNKTHAIKIVDIKSFLKKSLGLIGKEKPQAIFFRTRYGIHTFGMRFPIDVIILDEKNKVVKLKEHLQPNKFFFWNLRYNNVVELPDGIIKKEQIFYGDVILLY